MHLNNCEIKMKFTKKNLISHDYMEMQWGKTNKTYILSLLQSFLYLQLILGSILRAAEASVECIIVWKEIRTNDMLATNNFLNSYEPSRERTHLLLACKCINKIQTTKKPTATNFYTHKMCAMSTILAIVELRMKIWNETAAIH